MKVQRDEEALQHIISRLSKSWRADAELAVKFLYEQLEKGIKTDKAIKAVEKKFPQLFLLPGITDCLVEAAALGYGIVPSGLTSAQQSSIVRDLSKSWDASGMTLSQKLHSVRREMRKSIELIIKTQLRKNASWIEAARALYDGYNAGHTVRIQELPKYLNEVRRATQGSFEAMGSARKALRNIQRLSAKGAPTKALKAAYTQLVKAAETGSSKQLEKAVWTAMQEKSRYVAERIIRTETSRAYTDGFLAQSAADEDVVGFRWRLSTRHPVYDICNMYAKANIFGLGKGVFPKDKVPKLPVHPHCMCRLEEVYDGEINQEKEKANTDKAINSWLDSQEDNVRERLLGVKGAKEWSKDGDWQQHMRGWQGFENPKSRLQKNKALGAITGALNNKNDPTHEKRDAHADKFYEARRQNGMRAFVDKIHTNTGYPKKRLESIYKHVFINEYDLYDGKHRFYASYEMSQSFQRLLEGTNIQKHDLVMLRHEHLELAIMTKLGYNYDKAHTLTDTKHNYAIAEKEWRENKC